MNAPLAQLLLYDKWATRTLLESCSSLTEAQLDASIAGAGRPIRELLVHIVDSQAVFIARTQGIARIDEYGPWPGVDRLIEDATRSGDELIAIAEALVDDSDIDLPFLGKTYRYPKSFFLTHAAAHGTEHRTQVLMTLADIGAERPDLDAWAYAAAAGFGKEV